MKLIQREQYLEKIINVMGTPDIKVIKMIIARTYHDEYQYEGVRIVDIADFLLT